MQNDSILFSTYFQENQFCNVKLPFIYWSCKESFTTLWEPALSIYLLIFNFGRYTLRKNLESQGAWGMKEYPGSICTDCTKDVWRVQEDVYTDQRAECCQVTWCFYKQWSDYLLSVTCKLVMVVAQHIKPCQCHSKSLWNFINGVLSSFRYL